MQVRLWKQPHREQDAGSAMIVTLLVMTVLTGLGTIVFTTASSNLQNAGRDRSSGSAMGVSEAGIAQAVDYIRANGTSLLTCEGPPAYLNCSNDWGYNYPTSGAGGRLVNLGGGREYSVWIQRIVKYAPGSGVTQGVYRIHSTGKHNAAVKRTVTSDITAKPISFPLGVFGNDYIREAGQTYMENESIFSKGCIGKRNNIDFTGMNAAYKDLVAGAHSARYISTSNVLKEEDCRVNDSGNIHKPPVPGACNASYRFDQDNQGGDTAATQCHPSQNGGKGLNSSYLDENLLRSLYGYNEPRGLSPQQMANLKQRAKSQGYYYDCVLGTPAGACSNQGNLINFTPIDASVAGTPSHPVIYVRLAEGKTFQIANSMYPGFEAAPPANSCGKRSILLIVEGGDLHTSSNTDFVGSIFVPDGRAHFNGTATILGTVFAKSVFLNGGGTRFKLDQCFFDNMPGGLLTVSTSNFREIDR